MSDVVRKVGIIISAQDGASSVLAQVNASFRRSFEQFKADNAGLGQSFRSVADTVRAEFAKLAGSTDVKIGVEIAREKIDEAKRKIDELIGKAKTRAAPMIFRAKVMIEAGREWADELRRSIATKARAIARATGIDVPVRFAIAKAGAALQRVRQVVNAAGQNRVVRIGVQVASAAGNIGRSVMSTIGPLMKLARSGLRFTLSATSAGLGAAFNGAKAMIGNLKAGMGSLVSTISGGLLSIGLLPAAAGAGLALLYKSIGEGIDAAGKLSDRLGVSTEKLTALQYAAETSDVGVDSLNTGLQKMLSTLGNARQGSEASAEAFNRLGLDVQQLARADASDAFSQIAEKISTLPTASDRARAAMDIFGKQGQALMPMLSEGAAGIAKATAEAERLGLTFSRVDASKLDAANDAVARIGSLVKGYLTKAVIALAPYVEAVADKLLDWGTSAGDVGANVTGAVEWIASAVAKAADWVEVLKAGFYGFKGVVIAAVGGAIKAVDLLGQGVTQLLNLLPGVEVKWTDTFATMADSMAEDAVAAFDQAGESMKKFQAGANSKAVAEAFDEIRKRAQASAEETGRNSAKSREAQQAAEAMGEEGAAAVKKLGDELAKLTTDAATAGLSDVETKMIELRKLTSDPIKLQIAADAIQAKSAIDDLVSKIGGDLSIEKWDELRDTLDKMKDAGQVNAQQFDALRGKMNAAFDESIAKQAKDIVESIKSPIEKAQEEIDRINQIAAAAPDKLSREQADKAIAKIREGLQGQTVELQVKPVMVESSKFLTGISQAIAERAMVAQAQAMQSSRWQLPDEKAAKSQAAGSRDIANTRESGATRDQLSVLAAPMRELGKELFGLKTAVVELRDTMRQQRGSAIPVLDVW
jgi:hypothetical protein